MKPCASYQSPIHLHCARKALKFGRQVDLDGELRLAKQRLASSDFNSAFQYVSWSVAEGAILTLHLILCFHLLIPNSSRVQKTWKSLSKGALAFMDK